MKIVVLDGYTLNPGDLSWKGFEKYGDITVYDRTPKDQVISRIGDASVVLTNKTPITKEIFDGCPNMKYIGVLATGYNVVDVAEAKARGVIVTNIPTYGTDSVAQFVFALLLEICHNVGEHSESVKEGEWGGSADFCYWHKPLIELAGKTMGIIGYGRIGRRVAEISKAFGMKVLAYDISKAEDCVALETVLSRSDVISLHCPLFKDNVGLINKDTIKLMKDNVIIINTSRGPLINEKDLADALNSGKVYAAAVDVLSTEPPKADNPLLSAKNCYITPHIAWAPKEARIRLMNIAVENLGAFVEGKTTNVVS